MTSSADPRTAFFASDGFPRFTALHFRPDLNELRRVRAYVDQVLASTDLTEARGFDVKVAVSEAAANAIEHGTSARENRLTASLDQDRLKFEIVSYGGFRRGLRRDLGYQHRGLGLSLMAALVDESSLAVGPDGEVLVTLTVALGDRRAFWRDREARSTADLPSEHVTELSRQAAESERGRLLERLEAVSGVMEAVLGTLDLDELLQSLLSHLTGAMELDAAAILLREGDDVVVHAAAGFGAVLKPGFRVAVGQGVAGLVAQQGLPIHVADVTVDERVALPLVNGTGIQSFLAVPLRSGDDVIGVLHVDWFHPHGYDEAEEALMQLVADRCSLAIANAQLFGQAQKELGRTRLLQDVALAAGRDLDPAETARAVLSALRRHISPKAGEVALLDRDDGPLRPIARFGTSQGTAVEPAGVWTSLAQRAIIEGRPLTDLDDVPTARDLENGAGLDRPDGRHVVCPLRYRGRVTGVLELSFAGRRPFLEAELKMLRAVANTLAQALENDRLFVAEHELREADRERARRSDILHRVSSVALSLSEARESAERWVQLLKQELELSHAMILELDELGSFLRPLAVTAVAEGHLDELGPLRLDGPWSASRVVTSGESLVVEDVGRLEETERAELWRQMPSAAACVILPLWTRKGIIGTLSLGWPGLHRLTTDDLGFLRTIAAQIAVGLDSARLYEHKATVAETLQQALLTLPGSLPGVRFGHLYRSATEAAYVGGDFYDVFSLGDRRVAVLIGDVSGHGIEAATTASLVREVVRAYALDEDRPESVVAKTNRALLLRDTPGFATLFLATLDLAADTIAYCAAGHPPAFIGRDGGGVTALDRFNPALNVSDEAVYIPGLETFGLHDFLLLYTDGVIESRRGRELFGEARLAELVAGSSWDKVEQLPRRILSQLQRFSRGRLRDDLAIVAVAREPEPKPRRTRSKSSASQGRLTPPWA